MHNVLDPIATTARAAVTSDQRPRLDLYASIHKALRSFMADTLVRIGRIDVADRADRAAGLAQLELLLDTCVGHIAHENDFVHAAIEARAPSGSSRIAEEHVDHLASIEALRQEAASLADACESGTGTAETLALRLYRHLALFVAENFQHMHVEETQHNATLWQHYSDAELFALHDRLTANLAPPEALRIARWMVPASTPAERAMIVGGMATQMPPEALLSVMAMLRPHLDAAGWLKLAPASSVDPQHAA